MKTPPNHVVVFDFDGTLISKKYKSLFDVMDKALSESGRKEIEKLRQIYIPKILAQEATLAEEKLMVARPVEIYAESGLTISQAKEILAKVKVREGVKETMTFLQDLGLPIAIISYSFAQFIEVVLEENGLRKFVSQIHGTNLVIQDDAILSYKPETFVFSGNKGKLSFDFALKYQTWIGNILAVGDSSADYELGCFKKNRLGIAQNEEEKKKIEKFFGEVIVTQDFWPVLEWLKRKIKTA